MKAIVGGIPITIDASPMRIKSIENPIINVEHDEDDEDLWGFNEEVSLIQEDERTSLCHDPHSNMIINTMLKKQGHFPGMTLGKKKGIAKSIESPGLPKLDTFGLGFEPTRKDLKRAQDKLKARRDARIQKKAIPVGQYPLTLNGQFKKEGATM